MDVEADGGGVSAAAFEEDEDEENEGCVKVDRVIRRACCRQGRRRVRARDMANTSGDSESKDRECTTI